MGDDVEVTVSGTGGVSRREAEVLQALGARLTNAQIAGRLHISIRTVESHVSSLLRKYGVTDRQELAALAVPAGELAGELAGLPVTRTSFIGRRAEQEAITAAFTTSRLVTLAGPGGVGKTRLAVAVAGALGHAGAYVDLVPVRDGFVAEAVAAALGVSEQPQRPLGDAIADRLGTLPALLVLDNCEHLLDEVAGFADRLLARCPGTRVLATSRERLGMPGERVMAVEPLPARSDAVTLFRDRAAAAGHDALDAGAVETICSRLDGLPLAIELAAARSAALGAEGLLAALDDNLRLLAGGRGADSRHRSLRAVLAWSHDLLSDAERALLRRLSVFTGGFDLAAAVAVSGDGRVQVADVLGRLVDKSLVQRGAGRWWLLETVRAFAAEHLTAAGETPAVRARHLHWAATTAETLTGRLRPAPHPDPAPGGEATQAAGVTWWADFDAVADNLRTALTGATPVETAPGGTAHRLARSLARLAYGRRFLREAIAHYRHAATLALTHRTPHAGPSSDDLGTVGGDGVVGTRDAAADLGNAAECALAFADSALAYELQLAAAEQARGAGDGDARAIALARAAVIAGRHPGFGAGLSITGDRLRALTEEAATAGDQRNPYVAAHVTAATAWTTHRLTPQPPTEETPANGRKDDAARATGGGGSAAFRAVEAARVTGDPVLVSGALDAVVSEAAQEGRLRDAYRTARERLTLRATMDPYDPRSGIEIVDTLHTASVYAIGVGDLPGALEIAGTAMRDDVTGGHPALAWSRLIAPLVLTGAFREALAVGAEMWESQARMDAPPGRWMGPALVWLALTCDFLGDDAGARSWRDRAEAVGGSRVTPLLTFAEIRTAVDRLDDARPTGDVAALVERAGGAAGMIAGYAMAAAVELAVAAGSPDARKRLAAAEPFGRENAWAAACLARATGRLASAGGDASREALEASVAGWERIGARYERARTLLLLPGREAEGRDELTEMGVILTDRSKKA